MTLCDEVRAHCAAVAERARSVRIASLELPSLEDAPAPQLDPQRHYLEGSPEDVADYLLALDTINFGSGWFPTLRKRPSCSGYFTVAWALADHYREHGPWDAGGLKRLSPQAVAEVLGQDPEHELMALYAQALNDLGAFLADRRAADVVAEAGRSAERLAETLAGGMPFFDDRGFYKRAQITANDLALAGVAEFDDLDRLTIFADNLVPHVLRLDGVLEYDPALVARIDAGELIPPGGEEQEIRACALVACARIAARLGIPDRYLDVMLWNRGQQPRYKTVPRHRTRTVFY